MTESIRVPVRLWNKEKWGALAYLVDGTQSVDFIAEKIHLVDEKYSFADGHRVRRYRAKKQVHFTIPTHVMLDITAVVPAVPPVRRHQRKL